MPDFKLSFPPTREAALQALNAFIPKVLCYAENRNFDRPGHRDVSLLSPYIRRRLITEQEVVWRVLAEFPFHRVEKFIQEVVWRTYWKGWLERNPEVWQACVKREYEYKNLKGLPAWWQQYSDAISAETNLSFFNDWVTELTETGYLHNHARMWFASVWIFTLKLPWQLGAMFMYRHLLDGDPASNTLSWRWVAGLQTKGKSYLARAENISQFSEGRWSPRPGELAEQACAVELDLELSAGRKVFSRCSELPPCEYGVLTTSEDLSVESDKLLMSRANSVAVLKFVREHDESSCVEDFARGGGIDALKRLGARGREINEISQTGSWIKNDGLSHVVIVDPPVGPNSVKVQEAAKILTDNGVKCSYYRSPWDLKLYELADKGFFPFWERVKKRIEQQEPLFSGKLS